MVLRGEGKSRRAASGGNVVQACIAAAPENVLEWVKKDKRRMLHVVYRVGDLDRTIKYICFCKPDMKFYDCVVFFRALTNWGKQIASEFNKNVCLFADSTQSAWG